MTRPAPHQSARKRLSTMVLPAVAELDRLAYRWLEERLAQCGVSLAEFRLVGALLGEREGLTQRELAKRLGVKPPTVSAALPKLEKDGLVERLDDPADARAYRVRLRGRVDRINPVLDVIEELDRLVFQDLSAAEAAHVRGVLDRAVSRLAALTGERDEKR